MIELDIIPQQPIIVEVGKHIALDEIDFDDIATLRELILGYDFQTSTVQPTVQSDGTPLEIGDRWLDLLTQTFWFWNGTYWLSEEIYSSADQGISLNATTGRGLLTVPLGHNLFLLNFSISGLFTTAVNSSNHWVVSLDRRTATSESPDATLTLNTQLAGERFRAIAPLNVHRDALNLGLVSYRSASYRIGTPPTLDQFAYELTYRLAKP